MAESKEGGKKKTKEIRRQWVSRMIPKSNASGHSRAGYGLDSAQTRDSLRLRGGGNWQNGDSAFGTGLSSEIAASII